MTLTTELDLDMIKLNHRAKYLGQRSFHSKVVDRTHTTDRCTTMIAKWSIKAKFHYAIWFEAGSKLVADLHRA